MSDNREKKLADLVVELEHREAAAKEARRVEKEEIDDLKKSISVLAEELQSGQASLYPEYTGEVCSICGDPCSHTVTISTPGGEPTPPACTTCLKSMTSRVKRGRA